MINDSTIVIGNRKKEAWSARAPSSNKPKNIFVFAGFHHLYRIIPALKSYLGCTHNSEKGEDFSVYRLTSEMNADEKKYLTTTGAMKNYNQKLARRFIRKYKINISDFPIFEKSPKSRHVELEDSCR